MGNPGDVVHVWTSGSRAKQVNHQARVSPRKGGQEKEAAASLLGILPKLSEASTNLEPQAYPVSLSQELDLHKLLE